MKFLRVLLSIITTLALSVSFLAAGFAVWLVEPVAHTVAGGSSYDDFSPLSRPQLVKVVDATREYTFGNHDELQLYKAIYDVDAEYLDSVRQSGGTVPDGFPNLELAGQSRTLDDMRAVFATASEAFCYSPDTISNLDDCNGLVAAAYPFAIAAVVVAVVGLVLLGLTGRKRWVSGALVAAGILVMVAFLLLLVWGFADIDGMTSVLHQLFFSKGNWEFSTDSLFACAFSNKFWMMMCIAWVFVSVILSVISILVGSKLK